MYPKRETSSARGSSLWLRPSTILVFSFVFAACAALLLGLRRWIDSRGGLPLGSLEHQHYTWTYGPMATLLILLSFWRRIEYHCKISQPWWEMLGGSPPAPAPAARSVLLDYVSPTQITSLYRSLKLWHVPVVASITTFLLLKLVVVLSATLFVLNPTSQPISTPVLYTTDFNDTVKGTMYSDATLWAFLANMEAHKDSTTRWNTPGYLAYQNFTAEIPSRLNITSVTTEVQLFQPQITCEMATTTVFWNQTAYDAELIELLYGSVASDTCFSGSPLVFDSICVDSDSYRACPEKRSRGRLYDLFRLQCDGEDEARQRYVIAVIDFGDDLQSFEVPAVTSTVCQIGYAVVRANVTHDITSGQVTANYHDDSLRSKQQLANTTDNDFAEILLGNLEASGRLVVTDERLPFQGKSTTGPEPNFAAMFHLVMSWLQFPDDLDMFLDATQLKQATESVLRGLAVEVARANLTSPAAHAPKGKAIILSTENRLFFRPFTLWTTISGFVAMSGVCFTLAFVLMRKSPLPRGIASIALQAAILSGSSTVRTTLKGSGHLTKSELWHRLDRSYFAAELCSDQLLVKHIGGEPSPVPSNWTWKFPRRQPRRAWSPLPMTVLGGVLTFSLPLVAIVSLEVLQRLSNQRHGLMSMGDGGSTMVTFFLRTTTVLVIMVISTLYNNLEFVTAVMAPFVSLRHGSASGQRSILFAPLDTLPFLLPISHLSRRSLGSASISLTALLGGLLTVAASGLWVTTGEPAKLSQTSVGSVESWDYSWFQDWSSDNGAAARLNVIRHGGGPSAAEPLILQEIVLPRISIPDDDSFGFDDIFTYSVSALRPTLRCNNIANENINATLLSGTQSTGRMDGGVGKAGAELAMEVPVPSKCVAAVSHRGTVGDDMGTTMVHFEHNYNITAPKSMARVAAVDYLEDGAAAGSVLGIDCPTAVFFLGIPSNSDQYNFSASESNSTYERLGRKSLNVTAIACSQGIDSVPVTVQLKKDLAVPYLVPVGPVVLHNDAAEPINNGSAISLGFKIHDYLNRGYGAFPGDDVPFDYDRFFNHLLWGSDGVSLDDITGTENTDKFREVVTRDYEQYMRLIIDRSFRPTDLGPGVTNTSSEVSGTTVRHVTRLAVHRPSKVALQVILSAMTVLGLTGRLMTRQRGILPRSPCSIASVAALLADSQMCDPNAGIIPEHAQRMSAEELQQSLDGWVFSLDWWDARSEMVPEEESEATLLESVEEMGITEASSNATPPEDRKGVLRRRVFGVDAGRAHAYNFR